VAKLAQKISSSPCIAKQVIVAVKGVETTPEEELPNLVHSTWHEA
jgi:hypothetical protein